MVLLFSSSIWEVLPFPSSDHKNRIMWGSVTQNFQKIDSKTKSEEGFDEGKRQVERWSGRFFLGVLHCFSPCRRCCFGWCCCFHPSLVWCCFHLLGGAALPPSCLGGAAFSPLWVVFAFSFSPRGWCCLSPHASFGWCCVSSASFVLVLPVFFIHHIFFLKLCKSMKIW